MLGCGSGHAEYYRRLSVGGQHVIEPAGTNQFVRASLLEHTRAFLTMCVFCHYIPVHVLSQPCHIL